jgi:hypothetical protein
LPVGKVGKTSGLRVIRESAISDQLSLLAGILPQGAVDILREQIGRLAAGSWGFELYVVLAVALWSAKAPSWFLSIARARKEHGQRDKNATMLSADVRRVSLTATGV